MKSISKVTILLLIIVFILLTSCGTANVAEKQPVNFEVVQRTRSYSLLKLHANPSRGYKFDAYIRVPNKDSIKLNNLLVIPNNNGFPADIKEIEKCVLNSISNGWEGQLARELNAIALFPVFPRTKEIYYHAYGYKALHATGKAKRLDLQLLCMIEDTRELILNTLQVDLENKILMAGVSANSCFSLRFAILHPDTVEAVAAGVPGPFPTLPVKQYEYPFGVLGIKFDYENWKNVKFLIYEGDSEENTPWDEFQYMLRMTGTDNHLEAWLKLIPEFLRYTDNVEFIIYKNTGHKKQMQEMIEFLKNNSDGKPFTPVNPSKEATVYLSTTSKQNEI